MKLSPRSKGWRASESQRERENFTRKRKANLKEETRDIPAKEKSRSLCKNEN